MFRIRHIRDGKVVTMYRFDGKVVKMYRFDEPCYNSQPGEGKEDHVETGSVRIGIYERTGISDDIVDEGGNVLAEFSMVFEYCGLISQSSRDQGGSGVPLNDRS